MQHVQRQLTKSISEDKNKKLPKDTSATFFVKRDVPERSVQKRRTHQEIFLTHVRNAQLKQNSKRQFKKHTPDNF